MLVHIFKRFLGNSSQRSTVESNTANNALSSVETTHIAEDTQNIRNAMWASLRAALRGDQEAQYQMGLNYLNGQLGLDRSYIHAEKWLEQAAHQGHPFAKEELKKAYNQLAFS
ncbi:SEL1-like repeat protein [Acinetobacter defluvii]|uniref:SEL1-like repeat protein n=1 Tax=Acinetobacter defluvii TaxID=1871111 RepID=A0A2S2FH71_9GAMM|nr:SEL1-like repeat protein [Acinetobacter defluvii]AWL30248.1 SEL1-like repeat protein [Acinetobacter defluvii]